MSDPRKATVKFLGEKCRIRWAKYGNGRTAIELMCADGSPMARATVNLADDVQMSDDEVAIKDYSENAGMLEALEEAGIVGPPLRHERTGFVTVPICKLLVTP